MKHNNKILIVLIVLSMIFIMGQLLGPVSAAAGNTIDKGTAPHKNLKSVKVTWTAKVYKNNKLEVNKYFSKNNVAYKVEKTTFKRISKSKLKASTVVKQKKTTTKTSKYVNIKKSMTIKSYYFNVHQPKMHKIIVTSKSFDSGGGSLSNMENGEITWNANIYYNNKKVFIKENVSATNGSYVKNAVIEMSSKGKLKVTTNHAYNTSVYDSKTKKYLKNIRETTYVKSKLSPKDYYLGVYKPKMTKYLSYHFVGGCVLFPMMDFLIYKESGYANLSNSSGIMEWSISQISSGNIKIIRNYTDNSFVNSTTTIEQFDTSSLKVSVLYSNGDNTPQISYVNYSLSLYNYLLNVYKPEMLKLIEGTETITELLDLSEFYNS